MFNEFFSFLFYPILDAIGPGLFVLFMAAFISILICLITKRLTPQDELKKLTFEIRELNGELKAHIGNQSVFDSIRREISTKQMRIHVYSIVPTILITISMFILFGWMSSTLSYTPIHPDGIFNVVLFASNNTKNLQVQPLIMLPSGISKLRQEKINQTHVYTLKGQKPGNYTLLWEFGDREYSKNVTITRLQRYEPQYTIINDGIVNTIGIEYLSLYTATIFGLNLTYGIEYILCAIILSVLFRKLFDVY